MSSSSSSLRVLIIVPSLARGGAERQAVLLASALHAQGFEVRLLVQSSIASLAEDGLVGALPVEMERAPTSLLGQIVGLRRAVEVFEPHAVVTFLRGTALRFAVVRETSASARRAAWIVTARGNLRLYHFAGPAAFGLLLCHRAADRICANSSSLAANLFAMDGVVANKVAVVPNVLQPFALDACAREKVTALVGGPSRRPVLGCVGSFQDDRNHVLLADAMPAVLRAHPDAHLLAIGRFAGYGVDGGAPAFRGRVEALGLQEHVTMPGEIADARALLPGLDVFAFPSKLEGSSNALAEAMLAGVATATVPVGDAEDLVSGGAVVSRGFTPSAFADAILAALADAPALRERAALRGRALAAERSPARVGERWAALILEAIEVARARRPPA